jgi:hypothetical protein
MSLRLLDANGAKQFLALINSDQEFRLVSRDITLNLCLEVGSERRLINFRDGKTEKIGRFVPLTEPVDITIKGPSEFWQLLLSPVPAPGFQNLYAGVRFKKCEVSGNSELYFAYYAAITRMIELMRDHENG